jgi:hypothetical protein
MEIKHFFKVVIAAFIAVVFSALAGCASTGATTDSKPEPAVTEQLAAERLILTWTLVTQSGISDYVESVAYGNGRFVVVGIVGDGTSKMAYSSDGINWTAVTNIVANSLDLSSITFCGEKFFLYGFNKMASSIDGENWTVDDYVYNLPEGISAPAYGNGKYVFVTSGGRIIYSPDGVTWTETTKRPSGFQFQSIAFGDGKFVAGADGGKFAYSTDGITWTAVPGTYGISIRAIAYGADKFVASARDSIAYSTDGVTWTRVEISAFNNSFVWSIVYGGGKFVAISNGNVMAYSADGITWTEIKFNIFDRTPLTGIAYGGGRFVVVGSPDNWTWSGRLTNEGKIAYSNLQE